MFPNWKYIYFCSARTKMSRVEWTPAKGTPADYKAHYKAHCPLLLTTGHIWWTSHVH